MPFLLTLAGPTHRRDDYTRRWTQCRRLARRRARRQPSAAGRCAHPTHLPARARDPPRTRGARRHHEHAAPRLLADLPLGTPCVRLTASLCPPSLCVQMAPKQRPTGILAASSTSTVRPPASAAHQASARSLSPPLARSRPLRPSIWDSPVQSARHPLSRPCSPCCAQTCPTCRRCTCARPRAKPAACAARSGAAALRPRACGMHVSGREGPHAARVSSASRPSSTASRPASPAVRGTPTPRCSGAPRCALSARARRPGWPGLWAPSVPHAPTAAQPRLGRRAQASGASRTSSASSRRSATPPPPPSGPLGPPGEAGGGGPYHHIMCIGVSTPKECMESAFG